MMGPTGVRPIWYIMFNVICVFPMDRETHAQLKHLPTLISCWQMKNAPFAKSFVNVDQSRLQRSHDYGSIEIVEEEIEQAARSGFYGCARGWSEADPSQSIRAGGLGVNKFIGTIITVWQPTKR